MTVEHSTGQVIMVFALMMVIYGVTLVLLCGEVASSRMTAMYQSHYLQDEMETYMSERAFIWRKIVPKRRVEPHIHVSVH